MDRRKTIAALVHDQVNKFHNQQLIIWAKIQLQALIWILPSLQRKTGGRGEEIDYERQFRVTFENPCRIKQKKMLTQFFHFVSQPRSKTRACEDFQHDVAPWLFLQTDALAVSIRLFLFCQALSLLSSLLLSLLLLLAVSVSIILCQALFTSCKTSRKVFTFTNS